MTTKKSFSDIYDALQDAMRRNNRVSIKYNKLESTMTTRTIDPKRFVVLPERQRTKYGRIGVNAFCHSESDLVTLVCALSCENATAVVRTLPEGIASEEELFVII